jgi:hypothetical protein
MCGLVGFQEIWGLDKILGLKSEGCRNLIGAHGSYKNMTPETIEKSSSMLA